MNIDHRHEEREPILMQKKIEEENVENRLLRAWKKDATHQNAGNYKITKSQYFENERKHQHILMQTKVNKRLW